MTWAFLFNKLANLAPESRGAEVNDICVTGLGMHGRTGFKLPQNIRHCMDSLSVEKMPTDAFFDRFQGAAFTKCNDGCPGGLSFTRSDAEVLNAGEEQCTATFIVIAHNAPGLPTEESYARGGSFLEVSFLWAGADYDQTSPQFGAGVDCEIDALVRNERGDDQIEIISIARGVEATNFNWRIDHDGISIITAADALPHAMRVCDEMVDSLGHFSIEVPEAG